MGPAGIARHMGPLAEGSTPDLPARAARKPRRLARAAPLVRVSDRVCRRDLRCRRVRERGDHSHRGRRAGATPAVRALRQRSPGRRRRAPVRALRRPPPRRPRARARRGDGALGCGDAGSVVRPRSLRHGVRTGHRMRRPPHVGDFLRAWGRCAAAGLALLVRSRRRQHHARRRNPQPAARCAAAALELLRYRPRRRRRPREIVPLAAGLRD